MIIEQPPRLLRKVYPKALWRMNPDERAVYLTFDDGPVPQVTPWVLSLLKRYGIKATFFLVGDNVHKYPRLFEQIKEEGHRIGNHTYNHIQGFKTPSWDYWYNTAQANELIQSNLFRPPHGHMRRVQYNLLHRSYRIVMWDVVTRDYSRRLTGEQVFAKVKRYVRNGSIITFHDSLRSQERLTYALPRSIEWLLQQGYQFKIFD